jgi:hypothetical protein
MIQWNIFALRQILLAPQFPPEFPFLCIPATGSLLQSEFLRQGVDPNFGTGGMLPWRKNT